MMLLWLSWPESTRLSQAGLIEVGLLCGSYQTALLLAILDAMGLYEETGQGNPVVWMSFKVAIYN